MAKELYNSDEPFNQEQIDALRLDVEDLSPKEREKLIKLSQKLNNIILEKFSPHIDYSKNPQEFPQRLIFAKSKGSIAHFVKVWFGLETKGSKVGFAFHPSEFILVWDRNKENNLELQEFVRNNKDSILRAGLNPETVLDKFIESLMHDFITHELMHLYHGHRPRLPKWFREAGAYFYTHFLLKELATDLGEHVSTDFSTEKRFLIAVYEELLEKYKDDIHKLFFRGKISDEIREKIFDEWEKIFDNIDGNLKEEVGRLIF